MAIVAKFRKAQRKQCKLSMAIDGLSGNGKSGLALAMAQVFANGDWSKAYAVDTENKSLDLYVGTTLHTGETVSTDLNIGDLVAEDGFRPSHYAAFRQAAIQEGGEVILFDSLSHLWQYEGGILSMVTKAQQENRSLNKYTVWGVPEIVAEKNRIMDLVRSPYLHTICTLRTKEKMEMVPGEDNKMVVQSLGEQQIIMPDFKYEPDLVVSMISPGDEDDGKFTAPVVKIVKSRYKLFKRDGVYSITLPLIQQLAQYLAEGTSPEELLELQRQDYITGVKEFLDQNPSARAIWEVLKEQHGLKAVKLIDLKLKDLKLLYSQIATD